MRVLLIADAILPVPPDGYGGTERIVHLLANELQARGHKVDLIAKKHSLCYGGRVAHHVTAGSSLTSRIFRKSIFQAITCSLSRRADVVHTFGRPDYLWALYKTRVPIVLHFQNPTNQNQINSILHVRDKRIHFVGVSRSQIDGLIPSPYFTVVHNATNLSLRSARRTRGQGKYLFFLGRLTSNKGVDTAIELARKTGRPLKIAGNIPRGEPGALSFFEQRVRPHLGNEIEWVGEVNDTQKEQLLRDALALVFPIRWQEPFGITVIEALACGVPVIASRIGPTAELIRDGATGFLCSSLEDMATAAERINTIDPLVCLADARERFSPKAMTDQILNVYENTMMQGWSTSFIALSDEAERSRMN